MKRVKNNVSNKIDESACFIVERPLRGKIAVTIIGEGKGC